MENHIVPRAGLEGVRLDGGAAECKTGDIGIGLAAIAAGVDAMST